MKLFSVIYEVDAIAQRLINTLRQVTAEDLGLDPRAGYNLYVEDHSVAVRTSEISRLNYYGGFEYVDKENIKVIGDYTFFLDDEERVQNCLDMLAEAA